MSVAIDPLADREERLVSVLTRARRRAAIDERWLAAGGGALVIAGLALVIIGWVGTSRTILVAGQIPYVVSGGLLGLGLLFLGSFLYFGYWLSLGSRQTREQLEDVNRSLTQIAALLEARPPAGSK
jgi:hypothetical protein